MACGDISGNVAGLQRVLKQIKYPGIVDEVGLRLGDPLACLPLLHFVLLKYSRHVCAHTLACGIELHGKTDQRFVEHAFRLMRDHLGVKTALTPAHFFSQGFAERKVLLLRDAARAARAVHAAGAKRERISQQRVAARQVKGTRAGRGCA
ncbi:hypothetical protein MNEG_6704 [Monoraphidium neglectum]|uniref:Centrosomal protein of 44 kDa n=1 Tax=Monoraphidium neglectum TaxID=145388 RepID=A0A0D2ML18_9CHLO|nr:hypothetical protein MNEG_6704 [Monoraphidium neglectum]KIZ01257.1 hypothetical protein MNEG_6704 [Monoraphidium neglectum]|eukprot:XP_013900276.1 hypothetical protein MNEG_6704 [Monoraphidium neglectum]